MDNLYHYTWKATNNKYGNPTVSSGHNSNYYSVLIVFSTEADAEVAAKVANEAFQAGYNKAKSEVRQALGFKG